MNNDSIIEKVLKETMERVIWSRSFCEPGMKEMKNPITSQAKMIIIHSP